MGKIQQWVVVGAVVVVAGLVWVAVSEKDRGQEYGKMGDSEVEAGAEEPESATYTISEKAVTLVNGRAQINIALGSAVQESVAMFGAPKEVDLDGDGDQDAVFFLTTDAGGSGTFYYVAAAINKEGRYFGTNAMFLGNRIAPQTIDFLEGRAVANYADHKPGEPFTTRPSVEKSVWIHFDAKNMEIGEFVKDFEGESNLPR